MAFVEDVIDLITAEVTHIGLSEDGETEYSGGSYEALVPSYAAADSGEADLEAPLEFEGSPNDGPITHFILKRTSELWKFVEVAESKSFNSDGRLNLTTAKVDLSVVTD